MEQVVARYFPILVFLGIASGLALLMAFAPMVVGRQKPDNEKTSSYECGLYLIGKWRFYFRGQFHSVKLVYLVFGR